MIQLKRCAIDGARLAIKCKKRTDQQHLNRDQRYTFESSLFIASFFSLLFHFVFDFVSFVSFICHMSAFAYMARCKMRCMQRSLPTIHVRATLIFFLLPIFFIRCFVSCTKTIYIFIPWNKHKPGFGEMSSNSSERCAHTLVPCGMCECVSVRRILVGFRELLATVLFSDKYFSFFTVDFKVLLLLLWSFTIHSHS